MAEAVATTNQAQPTGMEDSVAMTSAGTRSVLPLGDILSRTRKRDSSALQTIPSNADGGERKRRLGKDLRKQVLQAAHSNATGLRNVPVSPSRCKDDTGAYLDGALPLFEYSESEIEIIEAVGEAPHYKVFKVVAGNQSYHLHVYKYSFESMQSNGLPGPNVFFENARAAHARLSVLHTESTNAPTPRCYGYVNLLKLPQGSTESQGSPGRPLFRSSKYSPGVYTDFIYHDPVLAIDDTPNIRQEKAWQHYFKNKTGAVKYVLQGLVLAEVTDPWIPLEDSPVWYRGFESWDWPPSGPGPNVVARKIKDSLKLIHSIGVLQGDVRDLENIWLCGIGDQAQEEELRVLWRDFTLAKVSIGGGGDVEFRGRQRRELDLWRRAVKSLTPK